MLNSLALFGSDNFGILIPIIIFCIPIVAILTRHQQKMAELIHGQHAQQNMNPNPNANFETSQLREEVRQLRELMTQQALALENLRDDVKSATSMQARINENS